MPTLAELLAVFESRSKDTGFLKDVFKSGLYTGKTYATSLIATDTDGLGYIEVRVRCQKASAEAWTAYYRLYMDADGIEGGGLTGWCQVYVGTTHSNAWGVRGGLNINPGAGISGRGAGVLAQLYISDQAGGGGGTKSALTVEVWADGVHTPSNNDSFIYFSLDGNSTGRAGMLNLLKLNDKIAANSNMLVTYGSGDPVCTKGLRIDINGVTYYIPLTTTATN